VNLSINRGRCALGWTKKIEEKRKTKKKKDITTLLKWGKEENQEKQRFG
jgi:hypothetical protein